MRSLILKPNLLNIQKTLLMLMVVISLFNCGSNLTANSEGNSLLNNVQKSSDINKSDKADISYCFTDDPRDYTIATQYNEMGQGDAEEPFRIYTAAQLFSISRNVYALDKHYELCQDIDLDDFYGFGLGQNNFSIGSESYPFTGVFDGKQHQIISFNYDENANYYVDAGVYPVRALDRANTVLRNSSHQVGLFGKTLGAEIRNLQLARVEIRVANSDKVAALIGDASDTQVMEVRIEGNLKDAYNKNTIAARNEVGGLLGYGSNSRIDNSYSKVNLAGNDKLGGLVGASRELAILSSYAQSKIVGHDYAGGLVGRSYDYTYITEAYAHTTIMANNYIGGIVGEYYSSNFGTAFLDTYARVNIKGHDMLGGIAGYIRGGSISRAYAKGTVSGHDKVGGLVGFSNQQVSDFSTGTHYAFAIVDVEGNEDVGRVLGKTSYYTGSPRLHYLSTTSCIGTPCTSLGDETGHDDIQYFYNPDNSPMNVWSFSNTWSIVSGIALPYLDL